eukprot:m.294788 g.294788  ORF g.294788 m.294788 type:complete len:297 (+) comp20036_c0_seq22:2562-3452(+)
MGSCGGDSVEVMKLGVAMQVSRAAAMFKQRARVRRPDETAAHEGDKRPSVELSSRNQGPMQDLQSERSSPSEELMDEILRDFTDELGALMAPEEPESHSLKTTPTRPVHGNPPHAAQRPGRVMSAEDLLNELLSVRSPRASIDQRVTPLPAGGSESEVLDGDMTPIPPLSPATPVADAMRSRQPNVVHNAVDRVADARAAVEADRRANHRLPDVVAMTRAQLVAEKKSLRLALKHYEAKFEEEFNRRPRDADKRNDDIDDLYIMCATSLNHSFLFPSVADEPARHCASGCVVCLAR